MQDLGARPRLMSIEEESAPRKSMTSDFSHVSSQLRQYQRPRSNTEVVKPLPSLDLYSKRGEKSFLDMSYIEDLDSTSETEEESFIVEGSVVSEQAKISCYRRNCEAARRVKLFYEQNNRIKTAITQIAGLRQHVSRLKEIKNRIDEV
jgi:hypothetical protein